MRLAVCLLLATAPAVALTAGPPDVAELKKQLAAAEAKVAELRAKLAAVETSEPTEFKDTKTIAPGLMKVGEKGRLADQRGITVRLIKALELLGDDSFVCQPSLDDRRVPNVIVKGYPTKGMADGQTIDIGDRVWRVVGTERVDGKTLMVIRPEPKADSKKK